MIDLTKENQMVKDVYKELTYDYLCEILELENKPSIILDVHLNERLRNSLKVFEFQRNICV